MSKKSELLQLHAALAEAKAKLARPNNKRPAYNSAALTTKQHNDLRAAAKRIAGAWASEGMPDDAWIIEQLDALPAELRELRPVESWAKAVRSRLRKARVEKYIV